MRRRVVVLLIRALRHFFAFFSNFPFCAMRLIVRRWLHSREDEYTTLRLINEWEITQGTR